MLGGTFFKTRFFFLKVLILEDKFFDIKISRLIVNKYIYCNTILNSINFFFALINIFKIAILIDKSYI